LMQNVEIGRTKGLFGASNSCSLCCRKADSILGYY
jgi:hypothetical protein